MNLAIPLKEATGGMVYRGHSLNSLLSTNNVKNRMSWRLLLYNLEILSLRNS